MDFKPFVALLLPLTLLGCGATSQKTSPTPVGMATVQAQDEPCWIQTPDCAAQADQSQVFFVGQSEKALASWGRPPREAFHSAQKDAELQYAKFLGVAVSSTVSVAQTADDQGASSRFEAVVQETLAQRISDLKKSDQYFVSNAQTPLGEPLWNVYVLLKIAKSDVEKHRQQILAGMKGAPEPAALPTPPRPEEASAAQPIYGIWEGSGTQDNGQSWTIKATLGPDSHRIDYPSLECGGPLALLEQSGNTLLFQESLSQGRGCITNGRAAITFVSNTQARFEWFYPNGKKGGEGQLWKKR